MIQVVLFRWIFSDDLEKKNIHKILNNKKIICIFNKTINKIGITKNYNILSKMKKNYDVRNYIQKNF